MPEGNPGGYRKPSNPAPVSGPGAMSARTDGGPSQPMMDLPDAAYGEQADFQEIQAGAPMAADPMMDPRMAPPSVPPPPGLLGPTDRPSEPLMQGAPMGDGSNRMMGQTNMFDDDMVMLQKYLPAMRSMAMGEGVPRSFQNFVRYLESYG